MGLVEMEDEVVTESRRDGRVIERIAKSKGVW